MAESDSDADEADEAADEEPSPDEGTGKGGASNVGGRDDMLGVGRQSRPAWCVFEREEVA